MEYYDLVLGSIPASILGVTGVLSVFGVGFSTAIPIGAVLATLLIGHALFVRAPSAPPRTEGARPNTFQSAD